MKLKVIGSGSSGNCYKLSTSTGSLLLEAGLPWAEIQQGVDFNLSDIKACLCTHAHKDHSKSIPEVISEGIDVYASMGTWEAVKGFPKYTSLMDNRFRRLLSKEYVRIHDFGIMPFETEHDAPESLGFLIQYLPTGEKLLFLTDSFYCKYQFNGLNYILIECNYILDILNRNIEKGLIDEAMKRRLLGSHFSLDHVKDFLKANDLSQCREILLLHLSNGNSDAARMLQEISCLTGISTHIAEPGLELELQICPY